MKHWNPSFAFTQDCWLRSKTQRQFSYRTDPKPRPEGYRDFRKEPVQHFVHATQWIPTETDGIRLRTRFPWAFKEPFQKPAEALEPSQTGELPPEPSKGRGEAARGVETAFLNQP